MPFSLIPFGDLGWRHTSRGHPNLSNVSSVIGGAAGLALQPDSKTVVCGAFSAGGTLGLVRFTPEGALDSSFSSNGLVTT